MTECDHIPLSQCTEVKLGKTIPVCRGFPRVTKRNITRIRLLVTTCTVNVFAIHLPLLNRLPHRLLSFSGGYKEEEKEEAAMR